jgi:hypothetical protein
MNPSRTATPTLSAPRQRQKQRDLVGEAGGDRDLALREREHALIGRVLRIGLSPVRESGARAHRIARHLDGDGAEREPARGDRIRLRRSFERRAAQCRIAHQAEQLLTARFERGGVREITLALLERPHALDGVVHQKLRLAAQPVVALSEVGRSGSGGRVELADGRCAVAIREGDLRGHQRPRGGHRRARGGRHGGVRLLGGLNIARKHPLFRAEKLVIVALIGHLRREIAVHLRGVGVLALGGEALRVLEIRGGRRGLAGLHQAARRGQHQGRRRGRADEARARRWTSRVECHTLHFR